MQVQSKPNSDEYSHSVGPLKAGLDGHIFDFGNEHSGDFMEDQSQYRYCCLKTRPTFEKRSSRIVPEAQLAEHLIHQVVKLIKSLR